MAVIPRSEWLAIDVLSREPAVRKTVALDAELFALLAGLPHRLADAERHEADVAGVMIGDVVKTLCRELLVLLFQMCGDSGSALKRFGHGKPVVETPQEVRRDGLIQRVHVGAEQGAGKALEQFVAFVG